MANETTNMTNMSGSNFTNVTSQHLMYPADLVLAYNVFLGFTIAFGIAGNLLVLIVFFTMKIASSADWFIVFITLLDFTSSFINVPVYLTQSTGVWKYYGNDVICKMHMYLSQVVVISSAFIIACFAIERYLKVCRPCSVLMSRDRARDACLVSCVVSVLVSIPTASYHGDINGVCRTGELTVGKYAYFATVFFLFVICFLVMGFCYMKICLTIRKSARSLNVKFDIDSCREEKSPRVIGANKIRPSNVDQPINVLQMTKQQKIEPNLSNSAAECSDSRIELAKRGRVTCFGETVSNTDPLIIKTIKGSASGSVSDAHGSTIRTLSPKQPLPRAPNAWISGGESMGTRGCSKTHDQSNNVDTQKQEAASSRAKSFYRSSQDRLEFQMESVSSIFESNQRDTRQLFTTELQRERTSPSVKAFPMNTLQNSQAETQKERVLQSEKLYQRNSKQSLQTTKIALLVCMIYTISWIIPLVCFVLFRFVKTTSFIRFALFGRMAYLINTFTNPFLYAWLNLRFRQKLKTCLGFCRPR